MKVQIKHEGLGISRPYWTTHNVPNSDTLGDAAYQIVRSTHPFLIDNNHSWDAGPRSTEWGGKTHNWTSVVIRDLLSRFWFAVEYREPVDG